MLLITRLWWPVSPFVVTSGGRLRSVTVRLPWPRGAVGLRTRRIHGGRRTWPESVQGGYDPEL